MKSYEKREGLYNPVLSCQLQGAVRTLTAIGGAVPIVHSNAGCVLQGEVSLRAGHSAVGTLSGFEIPGTNVLERHVIFGGTSRLREQIKNTLKVVSGELYVVLGSCASAMVGDDLGAMAQEAANEGYPVLHCETAGFCGDGRSGYARIMTALLKDIGKVRAAAGRKQEGLVNIFGVLPGWHPYWRGELLELKRILEAVGLQVNTFFTGEDGVSQLERAKDAAINLVFSKWGAEPAAFLEKQYQIPTITRPHLPVGYEQVKELLDNLSLYLIGEEKKKEVFLREEQLRYQELDRFLQYERFDEGLNAPITVVGETAQVLQYSSFLKAYFQAEILAVIVTDVRSDEERQQVLRDLEPYTREVCVTSRQDEIHDFLKELPADIILGSSAEADVYKNAEKEFLFIASPILQEQIILYKSYSGTEGGIRLIENFASAVIRSNRKRRENNHKYIIANSI